MNMLSKFTFKKYISDRVEILKVVDNHFSMRVDGDKIDLYMVVDNLGGGVLYEIIKSGTTSKSELHRFYEIEFLNRQIINTYFSQEEREEKINEILDENN